MNISYSDNMLDVKAEEVDYVKVILSDGKEYTFTETSKGLLRISSANGLAMGSLVEIDPDMIVLKAKY